MKIIVDAMGGDHAPEEILRGCERAVKRFGVEILLCGNKEALLGYRDKGIDFTGMEIADASEVIEMTDHADSVVREKKDSSMAVGLGLLRDGAGDAFVSAGNTGALLTGATLIVKRIRGVKRAAFGAVVPTATGKALLLDSGANAECPAEYLHQFALMGTYYMRGVYGIEKPSVGLLNNGAEPTKGIPSHIEANALLEADERIAFVGNIEGRDGPLGAVDVIVADGFSGNVFLKTMEGMGKLISAGLKKVFYKNLRTKIGALLVKKELGEFKKSLDYSEFGGAPLLGISKTVIKAHGSSDARAVENAIGQAIAAEKSEICAKLGEALRKDEE